LGEPIKIGFVDIDRAVGRTQAGRAARDEFARKRRAAEAQISAELGRYQALVKDLEARGLSDGARFQKRLDLMEMRSMIESRTKELEDQLKFDQQRLEAPLTARLREVVREVGEQQGFSLIWRRGSPGVLYIHEALDITDGIVERYDR
jgi:Skp family chaperone for outer membrane proteins